MRGVPLDRDPSREDDEVGPWFIALFGCVSGLPCRFRGHGFLQGISRSADCLHGTPHIRLADHIHRIPFSARQGEENVSAGQEENEKERINAHIGPPRHGIIGSAVSGKELPRKAPDFILP
jgi:hypothetical protein